MPRILIVDDDPSILSLERLLLTTEGYEVLSANNPREGLALLKLYTVDLIIVDIMMPELNGFQFINLLRANAKASKTAIAFLTSKVDKRDILRAGEVGADFFVTKPIDQKAFLNKVAQFFEKHPAKQHPEFKFGKEASAIVKVAGSSQIVGITDLGIEMLTELPLDLDQVVEVSASIFQEIPIKNPTLRVVSVNREANNLIRVRLMFLDQDSESANKIQNWISYNVLKRSRHG